MSKQTATDWLEMEFIKLEQTIGVHGVMYELLEQAKIIDKQNLIDFAKEYDTYIFKGGNVTEEQYYNKTFKNK